MKKYIGCVLFFLLLSAQVAWAGPVSLAWTLSADDQYLGVGGGYRVYVGTAAGQYGQTTYTTVPGVGEITVNLKPGKYYFNLTAYTADGVESERAGEISGTVKVGAPSSFRLNASTTVNVSTTTVSSGPPTP